MTVQKKEQGLIQSFNMGDREARATKFESKLHETEESTMLIFLLIHCDDYDYGTSKLCRGDWDGWKWKSWEEEWDLDDFANALREVAVQWIAKSPFPEMHCAVVVTNEDDVRLVASDWDPNGQLQKDWAIDGRHHLQLGFCKGTLVDLFDDPGPAIYLAMSVDDAMYVASGSINPKEHSPIQETEENAANFRSIVSDVFQKGLGIWCRDLVNLRNEVMVKIRARLYGDDPEVEWKKFCDAGMVHFLDYLKIWQPPNR